MTAIEAQVVLVCMFITIVWALFLECEGWHEVFVLSCVAGVIGAGIGYSFLLFIRLVNTAFS